MAVMQPQPAQLQAALMQEPKGHKAAATATGVLPGLDSHLLLQIKSLDFSFVISDAQHPDMPIVYASDGFYSQTGYTAEEVIGRNCRFLQGPETERQKVMEIRDAIREDRCCQVCLLNYRKDGSSFLNQFFLSPIKNDAGIVTHYVGIQTDVSAAAQAGLLDKPEQMAEQQAAVALGTAAGCQVCDMVMQQQEVQKQLQQHGQQQQQPSQQQQQQQQQPSCQKQQQRLSLEAVPEVIQEEVTAAGQIQRAFQQSPPCTHCNLPSSLLQSLLKVQASFVLSDPRRPDCPIVHASPEFLSMTGYSREEVEGRNCRFLQGSATDPAEVARVREAMTATPPKAVTVTLLNYRKDGTPFWNALHVAPVRDAEGVLEYFIGVQLDVTQQQGQQQQAAAGAAAGAKDAAAGEVAAAATATANAGAAAGEAAAGDAAGGAAAAGSKDSSCLGPAPCKLSLRHKMAHMTATGAVRVACRGLSGSAGGLRRSMEDQGLPQRGYSRCSISSRPSGGAGGSHRSVSSWGGSSGGSFGAAADAAAAAVAAAAEAAVAEVDGAAAGGSRQ